MFSYLCLIITVPKYILCSKMSRPYSHAHPKSPHKVLKTSRFSYVIPSVLKIIFVYCKVALSANSFDWHHVNIWIVLLIPSYRFVQKSICTTLFSPQTSANKTNTIDDDKIRVGAWREFVVQLERDVVWMTGPENFAKARAEVSFGPQATMSASFSSIRDL